MSVIDRLTAMTRGLISRGRVRLVDDAGRAQSLQVEVHQGETDDDVEHLQPYGLTAVPLAGASALVVRVGAAANHPVVLMVEDRRYRITGLEGGEVALYDDQGQAVILRRDGIELVTPHEIRLGEGADAGVARVGDEVEVTIPTEGLTVEGPGGVSTNTAPVTITGTITSASTKVKAVS